MQPSKLLAQVTRTADWTHVLTMTFRVSPNDTLHLHHLSPCFTVILVPSLNILLEMFKWRTEGLSKSLPTMSGKAVVDPLPSRASQQRAHLTPTQRHAGRPCSSAPCGWHHSVLEQNHFPVTVGEGLLLQCAEVAARPWQ